MSLVDFRRGLGPDDGVESARLAARGALLARLDWPLAALDATGDAPEGIAPEVAAVVAAALCGRGKVAFRADAPHARARWLPPPRNGAAARALAAIGHALGARAPERVGVLIADTPEVVATLFDFAGWRAADQRALVFTPGEADEDDVAVAVRDIDDWRDRALPRGVGLLLGPGHDGDFAGVAAATTVWLDGFAAALASDLR